MFIIFSNAVSLGRNDEERDAQLKNYLKQPRCPKFLIELLHKVKNRYTGILVESVQKASDPEAYYKTKTEEMKLMITKLDEANNHDLYTNALFRRAKEMIDQLIKEKMEAEKQLHKITKKVEAGVQKREEDKKITEKAKEEVEKAEKAKSKL